MLIITNKKERFTFEIDEVEASASTDDDKLVELEMYLINSKENNCVRATDEKFLRDIHKEIGKFLNHIDACRSVGRINLDKENIHCDNKVKEQIEETIFNNQQENHLADMVAFDKD